MIVRATLNSEAETAAFAARLASTLKKGDVVLLSGQIGAGKSHFARAALRSLMAKAGSVEEVPSPTFTLVQTYQIGGQEIWHCDLYRLSDPFEVEELGLLDAFEEAITFLEWPEKLGEIAPPDALWISLSLSARNGARDMEIRFGEERWSERIKLVLSEGAN